jgi:hypothetical protein
LPDPGCGVGLGLGEVLGFVEALGDELGDVLPEALTDVVTDVLADGDGEPASVEAPADTADACAAHGSSSTPETAKIAPASAAPRRHRPAVVALVRIRFLYLDS